MSMKEHLRWIAVYVLAGAALAILAPILTDTVSAAVGVALGGLVVIGGALVHDINARNRRDRRVDHLLDQGELERVAIRAEMEDLRHTAETLARDTIRTLNEASAAGAMEALRAETRGEIRSLRAVVDKLSGRVERQQAMLGRMVAAAPPARGADRPPSRPLWRSRIVETEGLADEDLAELVIDAVRHDRIDLALQPIVSLPQRRLRHYQAFAHLRTDEGAIITPEQYRRLPGIAETGRQIDNVLTFRVAQFIRDALRRQSSIGVFTSLAPGSLADPGFLDEFLEFISANSELAGGIIPTVSDLRPLQIETLVGPHAERFRAVGLHLAVENFGRLEDVDSDFLSRHCIRFLKLSAYRLLDEEGDGGRRFPRSVDDLDGDATDPRSLQDEDPHAELRAMLDRAAVDLVVHDIDEEQTVINLLDYPVDYGQGILFGEPRLR